MIKKFVLLLVLLIVSFADESSVRKIQLSKKQKNELSIPLQYDFLPQDTKTLSITDYQNLQYYFTLELGTPAMTATFIVDTGSHLTWLPPVPKTSSQKYNYDQSSTYEQTTDSATIQYGIGQVSGMIGSEIVQVPELGVTGVRLDLIWAMQEEDMDGQKADGLTGLSNLKTYKNFLDLAQEDNQIKTSIFSMKLGFENESCHFYAGDYATTLSNITFLSCKSNQYWQIKVETMYVNDEKFTSSKLAVVDSGTSALVIPTGNFINRIKLYLDMANYFLSQFPTDICKKYESTTYGNFWGCECYQSPDNYPTFTFYTEKIKFQIDSADYMFEQNMDISGTIQCIAQPLIMTADSLGFMIFGDVFMRKYLITFDKVNNQVGFSGNFVPLEYLNNKVLYGLTFLTFAFFVLFAGYGIFFFCFKFKRSDMEQPFMN